MSHAKQTELALKVALLWKISQLHKISEIAESVETAKGALDAFKQANATPDEKEKAADTIEGLLSVAKEYVAMSRRDERGAMRGRWGFFIGSIIILVILILGAAALDSQFHWTNSGVSTEGALSTEGVRTFLAMVFGFGTMVTVFLAILFLSYADDEDFKERFEGLKYIFTVLIAILGTITGFYFGKEVPASLQDQKAGQQQIQDQLQGLKNQVDEMLKNAQRTAGVSGPGAGNVDAGDSGKKAGEGDADDSAQKAGEGKTNGGQPQSGDGDGSANIVSPTATPSTK